MRRWEETPPWPCSCPDGGEMLSHELTHTVLFREAVMQSSNGAVLLAALMLTGMMASDALAQRRESGWGGLWCSTVNFLVRRDVLWVGRSAGCVVALPP